jgi:hypothetical protein
MTDCFGQYFRCQERYDQFSLKGPISAPNGYFRLGENIVYGGYCGRTPSPSPADALFDALSDINLREGQVCLPFDPAQIADNLRYERYDEASSRRSLARTVLNRMYYGVRPFLKVGVRKYLQRIYFQGWDQRPFPHWPVDRTIDNVFEQMFLQVLKATGASQIPFIWFWPEGAPGCAIMTHDVETRAGRDFCPSLMDVDDSFNILASFQVVPELRYEVSPRFLKSISDRGFEICVHDLNHDGRLYTDPEQFPLRAAKINQYGREWGAEGFRAAGLYRNRELLDALKFSYDMSVPNVAHLDPQRGGCCTVMPYFVGKVLELPVTTIQDYTLFNILDDYSIDLWKSQVELILERHGLASFIVHPDYVSTPRELGLYKTLLAYIAQLRDEKGVWVTLPGKVNRWWRQRAEMTIVEDGDELRIQGAGYERARIAFASAKDGQLIFDVQPAAGGSALTLKDRMVGQS